MRRVAPGLALLLFLLTACSGNDDTSTAAPPPSPAPSPSRSPSPPPRVGTVVPSVGPFVTPTSSNIYGELPEGERSVLWDLERRVFTQAGSAGAIHGGCDKPFTSGAELDTDCTITFEGKPALFHVNGYVGSALIQYTVSQTTAVLGGIGVMNAWYRFVAAAAPAQVGTAKCDSSLPKAEQTSFGRQPYRCWYTASDGANVEKQVNLTEKGPAFD
jgi:hypothetical protein